MSKPTNHDLTPTVRGDTWPGLTASITVNAAAPAAALASARIQWRLRSQDGDLGHEVTSADDSLVIDDAATWQMHVPAQILPLRAGVWYWDLETTDENGVVRTYVGGTHEILEDVTK